MSVIQNLLSDKALVEKLMVENRLARDDDRILIFDYLTKCLKVELNPMDEYLIKHGKAFESLTRARRTIQNKERKLQATEEVKMKRMKREIEIRVAQSRKVIGYEPLTNSMRLVYSGEPIPINFISKLKQEY